MSKRLPYMQFWVDDWMNDEDLILCTSATLGVWINFLCAMHRAGRTGKLTGTRDELAILARRTVADVDHALSELAARQVADVTERAGVVTVVNRRMRREAKAREHGRKRAARHRQRGGRNATCNEKVPSVSVSDPPGGGCKGEGERVWPAGLVEQIRKAFPAPKRGAPGEGRDAIRGALDLLAAEDAPDPAAMLLAQVQAYARSPKGKSEFGFGLPRWMAGECWRQDPDEWQEAGQAVDEWGLPT